MKNLQERIKAKKIAPPEIEIKFDSVTLTIPRVARSIVTQATAAGRKRMREEGMEPDDEQFTKVLTYGSAEMIGALKPYITGWKWEGEDLEFSRENLDAFIESLNDSERALIGAYYLDSWILDESTEKKILQILITHLLKRLETASSMNSEEVTA